MTELRHHATITQRAPLTGEQHELDVWGVIDPGEPGSYTGHPDSRYPADPARVDQWVCVHVDGWPARCNSHATAFFFRYRIEIETAFLADWHETEYRRRAEEIPDDADERIDERLTWRYHHAAG